jgi:iron complex outermembrane receptor protein
MKPMNKAAIALLAVACASPASAEDGVSGEKTRANDDMIEEIVVSGQKLTTQSATIAVDREIVLDAADAFSRLPGADRNKNGPLTGIAQYRGMYGDRVSVNIDGLGIISGGPNAMDAPLSYVSPMITEELTLERGIPGVASAPEAIGGHVDARMARGRFGNSDAFGMSGMAGARYSDNGDTTSAAARLTLSNQSHRISMVGQADRGDDQDTPAGTIVPSELARDRYDLSYAFRDDSTEFQAFAGRLETRDTGTPALAMDIRYIDSALYGVSLAREISSATRIMANVGYTDVDHVMDNFSLRPPPASGMQYRQNRAGGRGTAFALSVDQDIGAFTLRGGVDGRFAEHESYISNPNNAMFFIHNFNDVERDVAGAFVTLDRQTGISALEFGLRYVDVSSSAGEVSFGGLMDMMGMNAAMLADAFNAAERDLSWGNVDAVIKYSRHLGSNLKVNVDIGSKTRAPSYQELYLWLPLQATGGLADGRNYIGNLGLDAERSNEIAIGLDWATDRFSISPQAYFRDVDNYITGTPAAVMPANMLATMMSGSAALQFNNVDAEIFGLDLGWRLMVSERVYVDGNASYSRGRRTDISDDLYRQAPPNGSVAVNFSGTAWSLRGEVVAYDRQDRVSLVSGEQPSAGYAIVNGQLTWNASRSLRLELHANNLLDRGYQPHLAGVNRVSDVDIPVGERLWGAGRTLSVGAVMTF